MAHTQLTLNNVAYYRNQGSGGLDVVIGNMRRTTWTRSTDSAMSTGTFKWVAGGASHGIASESQTDVSDRLRVSMR